LLKRKRIRQAEFRMALNSPFWCMFALCNECINTKQVRTFHLTKMNGRGTVAAPKFWL
jgi:hypothetical protein